MEQILFTSGKVFLTKQAIQAFEANNVDYQKYVLQHCCGNWGEIGNYSEISLTDLEIQTGNIENTGKFNVWLLKRRENGSIMSSYILHDNTKVWIITVCDFGNNKNYTTILIPSEY